MRNIYESFTHKMAAKTGWHRYGTKLRHYHPVYTRGRTDGQTAVKAGVVGSVRKVGRLWVAGGRVGVPISSRCVGAATLAALWVRSVTRHLPSPPDVSPLFRVGI